ncbi:MAG: element excision factor XisH family protein [Saprospiraceae bacterium]
MAKDKYHSQVREALEREGWVITHDPYFIRLGRRKGYIDLGAEMIGAERGTEKIAVEIKTFSSLSEVDAFEDALGQFLLYKSALRKKETDRVLFLAVPKGFYTSFFDDPFFVEVAQEYNVFLLVYDETKSTIEKWIK